MKVGVVSTARATHATPAATYRPYQSARQRERYRAAGPAEAMAPTTGASAADIDVLMGGGRQFFVPNTTIDEEGGTGSRTDGRDLRAEFQTAGYTYVWNKAGFNALTTSSLPVLGLFERSHMDYEYDRPTDSAVSRASPR